MRLPLLFILLTFVICPIASAQYYDFSAIAPSGQKLYYTIEKEGLSVRPPGFDDHNPWQGYDKPTGDLVIPDHVRYRDTTYAVVEISGCCFLECGDLRSITLPSTLRRISHYSIAGCRSLKGAIVVPEGVTEIDNYAFCCSSMRFVILPNSLKTIGSSAFQDCDQLSYISVPVGVESIGENAFLHVPSVIFAGKATGAPWGAVLLNGKTSSSYIINYIPHIMKHGDNGD